MSYRDTTTIKCAKCNKEMKVYRDNEPHRWCKPCIDRNLRAQNLLRRAREKAAQEQATEQA